ncbi:hypothetical protein QQ008_07595 [Fulvivirgaceae bacterium BMA10]|uniref:Uncharacterized protein n=1 Tax=Splendidivirga corallicola TaxID=3051826 RepID=A0ABT8KKI6_9BACT|nr:hypothetical protein [Fulvivirgaceae bacterium BMA10]
MTTFKSVLQISIFLLLMFIESSVGTRGGIATISESTGGGNGLHQLRTSTEYGFVINSKERGGIALLQDGDKVGNGFNTFGHTTGDGFYHAQERDGFNSLAGGGDIGHGFNFLSGEKGNGIQNS